MSDDKRIGRQFPTQSVVLPYTETKGGEAVLFYDQSSRKAMDTIILCERISGNNTCKIILNMV